MTVGTPSDHRQGGRLSQSRMDDAVRRLGRFQIIGRLATGGMAEVYLALSGELPGFRTLIVVKRILPHLASNRQFIRMFLDEARLAALLDHPNVVRIIEVGHDGEEYFLAMELVQGKPLSAVLRKAARERRPPSPALSAYIIAQAASGLGYAHALTDGEGRPLGVVHRDVSPQNVLLSFEGAVKLIDFGVARAFGRVAHTSPGGLKGKIEYMSPEQASAEEVDHRADVFALGVVLWEVLTGRRLFRRETELATMRAIVDDPIPRPSEVADVPAELDAVVMRALRKRRDARFASAHEMALALERFAFANEGFSPQQVAELHEGPLRGRVPAVAEDGDRGAGHGGRAAAIVPAARRARRRAANARADDGAAPGTVHLGRSRRQRGEEHQPGGRGAEPSGPQQGRADAALLAVDGRATQQAGPPLALRRGARAGGDHRLRRLDAQPLAERGLSARSPVAAGCACIGGGARVVAPAGAALCDAGGDGRPGAEDDGGAPELSDHDRSRRGDAAGRLDRDHTRRCVEHGRRADPADVLARPLEAAGDHHGAGPAGQGRRPARTPQTAPRAARRRRRSPRRPRGQNAAPRRHGRPRRQEGRPVRRVSDLTARFPAV